MHCWLLLQSVACIVQQILLSKYRYIFFSIKNLQSITHIGNMKWNKMQLNFQVNSVRLSLLCNVLIFGPFLKLGLQLAVGRILIFLKPPFCSLLVQFFFVFCNSQELCLMSSLQRSLWIYNLTCGSIRLSIISLLQMVPKFRTLHTFLSNRCHNNFSIWLRPNSPAPVFYIKLFCFSLMKIGEVVVCIRIEYYNITIFFLILMKNKNFYIPKYIKHF